MIIPEFIASLIGVTPAGMEWLTYTISAVFLLSLLQMVFDVFRGWGNFFNQR